MTDSFAQIEALAAANDWAAAEAFARERYQRATSVGHEKSWGVQLLGCCFLNEADEDATYVRSIEVARSLASRFPDDAHVIAWCAWAHLIYGFDQPRTDRLIAASLAANPANALAQWLAACSGDPAEHGFERLGRVWTVLSVQPGNRAAQRRAMSLATSLGAHELARIVAAEVLAGPPFVLTNMGVWNDYANGAFGGTGFADGTAEDDARAILGRPSSPDTRA